MGKFVWIGVVSALLAGCITQAPLEKQTQSGKAEATFEGVSPDEFRNELVLNCTKRGAQVEADQYSVTCSQQDNSGRAFAAQVLVGNGYSQTPWSKLKVSFAPTATGVFATAEMWMEMTMGFGEVKRIPDTNVADRNLMQQALDAAAARVRARKALPGAAATPSVDPCVSCEQIGKH